MIALLALAFADVVEVDAPPSAAVVYASQARVTRTGSVRVTAGANEISFVNLPPSIDTSTLTADVAGSAELLGIDVRRVAAAEAADERVSEIEAALQDLRDDRQDANDDASAAQSRLDLATVGRTAAAAQLSRQLLVGDRSAAQAAALLDSMSAEDAAAREAVRQARQRVRELNDEIAALERERTQLGTSATDTWTATVRLEASRAGSVSVDLNYAIGGAAWRPRYDLRGDGSTGDVALALSAIVTNRTGEDWNDIDLSVSSARPGRGTDVPTLDPFWLQAYRRPARSRSSDRAPAAAPMAEMMSMDDMGPPAPPPPPMEIRDAEVEIQLAATTFVVDGDEDVLSDGRERKVLLTTEALESDLRHIVVPRLDPNAYLVGEVTNSAPFPLLPGEAGVFVDGAYIGEVWLDTVPTDETFDVSFGPDDRVTVRRTRAETTTGENGPVGRRQRATFAWDLDVRSTRSGPVTVELREQVPLSNRDDVEVRFDVDEGPAPEEEDGGVLAFTLPVRANSAAELSWNYTVTYPGDLSPMWME